MADLVTCTACHGTGRVTKQATANGLKEFCPKGHEYTAENTYRRPNSWRECRKCRKARKERARGGSAITIRHYAPGGTK